MAATAGERETALAPHVHQARAAVAELSARVTAAEAAAHEHFVGANPAAGHDAIDRAEALRGELATAQARLATLEQAAHAVAADRVREEHEEQLAAVTAAMESAADQAAAELANVRPCLAAARHALQAAQAYEQRANDLHGQQRSLLVALGRAEHAKITLRYNQTQVLLGEEPVARAVLQHPGF